MTIATTDEQRAVQESILAWSRSANPIETLRQDPADPWRAHWPALADLGVFMVAQAEEVGGADGEIVDLAVMLEQAAAALAAGPVLSTALAALVVGRSGEPAAKQWGPELAEGGRPVGVVLDGAVTAEADADGGLVLSGDAGLALGGAPGVAVLLPATRGASSGDASGDVASSGEASGDVASSGEASGDVASSGEASGDVVWCLLDADTAGLTVEAVENVDVSVPLATVRLDGVTVLAGPDPDRRPPGPGA